MGTCIIKVSKNRDLYMKWSSVVDNCTFIGTRQELLDNGEATPEDIDLADRTGTSARTLSEGGWESRGMLVMETETREHTEGLRLKREDFEEYTELMLKNRRKEAEDILINRFRRGIDLADN
ncbi:hypothetical protein [Rhodococcus qingshengii]|uniref:hypothetical protein n=1 Tax=Rhodococcus qingshengii TaxID=334542 RepID=UPI0035D92BBA